MMKFLELDGLKTMFDILPYCLQTEEGPKTLVLSYLNMMSGSINGAMEMGKFLKKFFWMWHANEISTLNLVAGQTEELLPMLKANLEKFAAMIDHTDLRVQHRVVDFFLSVTCGKSGLVVLRVMPLISFYSNCSRRPLS